MKMIDPQIMATGTVAGLALDGVFKSSIKMGVNGPEGDKHALYKCRPVFVAHDQWG